MALRTVLLSGIGALALHAVPADAQTLREALAAAYANNPSLLAARAQLRAVDENVPQALAGWRPTVTMSASPSYTEATQRSRVNGPTGPFSVYTDINRDGLTAAATVSQPIYRGGRTVASTRRAENQVLAQRARLLATEQQVFQDSTTAYANMIRDLELLRLRNNNVSVLTRQLQATNERFRVGEITRTDVAQAESRLAGARADRAQAEGNLQTSRATFERQIGIPPRQLSPPQPLSNPTRTSAEAVERAGMNNPTVVAALFDEAAARDLIDVNFSTLLPQATVQAQLFRNDNSIGRGTRATGSQVTATLSVPLYQGGSEHALVRQARQQAQQARAAIDDARLAARQQAQAAWETVSSARAQVDSVRAQIRAAEIALDGVQREAVVGSRTTLDVLNAEQELLVARVSLVQALANVVTASYTLTASVGRLNAIDLNLPVQRYDYEAYYRAVRDRWAGTGDYAPPPASVAPELTAPVR
ncbi:TolC family outer membrane protein [Roseomonas arctica]|uniref:TolC family outer membrane protein n=2 Tax=Plastoroseomonas arctica TaxID=1509237 RepID=A0AAF1KM19_9PROT|nr:TolC family outer membrane protein [Plastoroseomonas arctica]